VREHSHKEAASRLVLPEGDVHWWYPHFGAAA
jgi:hypothetical protein